MSVGYPQMLLCTINQILNASNNLKIFPYLRILSCVTLRKLRAYCQTSSLLPKYDKYTRILWLSGRAELHLTGPNIWDFNFPRILITKIQSSMGSYISGRLIDKLCTNRGIIINLEFIMHRTDSVLILMCWFNVWATSVVSYWRHLSS